MQKSKYIITKERKEEDIQNIGIHFINLFRGKCQRATNSEEVPVRVKRYQ